MNVDFDGINEEFRHMVSVDEKRLISSVMEAMDDGEITSCNISYVWQICGECRGEGSHSKRLGVISQESWDYDWDDDMRYDYMNGAYDSRCERCDGTGKVQDVDWAGMPEDVRQYVYDYRKDSYEMAAIYKSERMMGA